MDENREKKHIAEEKAPESYALEDILAEFQETPEPPHAQQDSLGERSKRLVLETLSDAIDAENAEVLGGLIDSAAAQTAEQPAPAAPAVSEAAGPVPAAAPAAPADVTGPPAPESPEPEVLVILDRGGADRYAAALPEEDAAAPETADGEEARDAREQRPARERFLSPVVALLALLTVRRRQRSAARPKTAQEPPAEEIPEPTPRQAIRACSAQMRSLRLRGRTAACLSLVMLYISFAWPEGGLPLTGALNGNIRVTSLLLIVLELAVMMCCLDRLTEGLLGIARGRMGAESLIAASCVLSLLDAALLALLNDDALGLPFCAVSALALTFALWSVYYGCKGSRTAFRVLTMRKELYTVTAETGLASGSPALLKSSRGIFGFIRRSDEPPARAEVYTVLTPFLLAAALILGLLASVGHGQGRAALHCVSILTAAAANFSATLSFTAPFAAAARRLRQSGAAIAGRGGVRDIGSSRRVVITDADVFPKGTVTLGNIRILEGTFTDKVISYTASVVTASGSGLAAPFAELVRRNGYTIRRVENFEPHDGGGITAMGNGERVCVGHTGFMNLMGVRLPQKLATRTSVYTAINGALVGIFSIDYHPVSSVQDALVLLLRSNLQPIFAIRDFNITPLLLKNKFRMPTDAFQFPPYAERYRISGAEPDNGNLAAVIAREGMGPLVDVAERGRRLYRGVRAAAALSAVCSVLGLLLMFLLCWMGAFDAASASNAITFLLLWLIPLAVIVMDVRR
jgi:hypothetical protein